MCMIIHRRVKECRSEQRRNFVQVSCRAHEKLVSMVAVENFQTVMQAARDCLESYLSIASQNSSSSGGEDHRKSAWRQTNLYLPKILNRLPPAPPSPCLAASVSTHRVKNSLFFKSSSLLTFVSNCGSWRSKANNVGILLIIYRIGMPPTPPRSGLSISTSTKLTPPCASPAPSCSIISRSMGETTLQELHQRVIQSVMRGTRVLADIRRRVVSSSSLRTVDG